VRPNTTLHPDAPPNDPMLVLRFGRQAFHGAAHRIAREASAAHEAFCGHRRYTQCVMVMPRSVPAEVVRRELVDRCVDPETDTLFAAPASPEEGEAIIAALARTGIVHTCYVIEGIAPETPTP